jgi:hypothetical protein
MMNDEFTTPTERPVDTALQLSTLGFVFGIWLMNVGSVPDSAVNGLTMFLIGSSIATLIIPELVALGGMIRSN